MAVSSARGGLFLLVGPDRARKWQRVQALEQSLGVGVLDQHHLDGTEVGSAELIASCRQSPAVAPFRLIVIDRGERLSRECLSSLIHHRESIIQVACVLILSEASLNKRHALSQFVDQFESEIYPSSDEQAQKPFALTDAMANGDVVNALIVFNDQLALGKEPFEVLGLVTWQAQRWITVKRLLNEGSSPDQIMSVVKLKPWQMQRLRKELANRSLNWLQQMLTRCWEVDRDAKSGRTLPSLAVEQLVVSMCSTGKN